MKVKSKGIKYFDENRECGVRYVFVTGTEITRDNFISYLFKECLAFDVYSGGPGCGYAHEPFITISPKGNHAIITQHVGLDV